jgi:hypothetical protein
LYNKLLGELSSKFEARFSSLQNEISLLKSSKENGLAHDEKMSFQSEQINKTSHNSSHNSTHHTQKRGNVANNPSKDPIVGSRKTDNLSCKIVAASRSPKTAIQVRNLDEHCTKEELLEYLESTFGRNEKFTLDKLNVKSGDYSSYKVVAGEHLNDKLLDPNNWPEMIEVRPFRQTFRFSSKRPSPRGYHQRSQHSQRGQFNK